MLGVDLVALPKLRTWVKGNYGTKLAAVCLMMVEPNYGEKLLDKVTITDTDKRAGQGANKATEKFYRIYNQVSYEYVSSES